MKAPGPDIGFQKEAMALSSVFPCATAVEPGAADRLEAGLLSGDFSGYPLATSNKPERVTDAAPQTLALFSRLDPSGTALAGRFRVFLAHGNDTGRPYTLAVGLANPANNDMTVSIGPATVFSRLNPSANEAAAGADALASWLGSAREWRPLVRLAAGEGPVFPESLQVRAETGDYAVGYLDLAARVTGQAGQAAAIQAGVIHLPAGDALPPAWPALAGPISSAPGRGLFRHAARRLRVAYPVSLGPRFFDVAQTIRAQFGPTYAWEYENGYSEADGSWVTNNGNYGVEYQIALTAVNDTRNPAFLGLQAGSPNPWCDARRQAFALAVDGDVGWCIPGQGQSDPRGDYRWPFSGLPLFPGQPGGAVLRTSTAAASCSPTRIHLLPEALAPGTPWAAPPGGR